MARKIAIIPARGGSKRIPRKNVRDFCGRPLITYPIHTAIDSKLFDRIIVSTDDEEISKVAVDSGAEVPFIRPADLADDFSTTDAVIKHALEWLGSNEEQYDYACTIYATAPLLKSKYLEIAFNKLAESTAIHAFSVTSMPFPIKRTFTISEAERCEMLWPDHFSTRSQDLEETFQDAGQFYWTKLGLGTDEIMFGKDSIPIILPRHLVQDIDTPEDWERAEIMYKIIQEQSA